MTKQSQTVAKATETPKMAIVQKQDSRETKQVAEPKALTIEELKRKSELMGRLVRKYDDLKEKHRQVENFIVSHNKDTAKIAIYDEQGEQFETNSPKTLERVLEFWLVEFSEAMQKTETEIRTLI